MNINKVKKPWNIKNLTRLDRYFDRLETNATTVVNEWKRSYSGENLNVMGQLQLTVECCDVKCKGMDQCYGVEIR